LSDLRGCFADPAAFESALKASDPIVYQVATVAPGDGDGDLHYAVGSLAPGRVGSEYFMTKGHLHSWREAAEFYIGLSGEGMLLLEDSESGESRMLELRAQGVVYVPGGVAHRTMNVGKSFLTYIGVYPAKAGHDYSAIAAKNFRCLVVERHGRPAMVERKEFLKP
jgi:glucose-6-phosphate isomerase